MSTKTPGPPAIVHFGSVIRCTTRTADAERTLMVIGRAEHRQGISVVMLDDNSGNRYWPGYGELGSIDDEDLWRFEVLD